MPCRSAIAFILLLLFYFAIDDNQKYINSKAADRKYNCLFWLRSKNINKAEFTTVFMCVYACMYTFLSSE